MKKNKTDFCKTLRKKRAELGMTQTELAKEIGITKNAIYLLEAGLRTPSGVVLKNLYALFGEEILKNFNTGNK